MFIEENEDNSLISKLYYRNKEVEPISDADLMLVNRMRNVPKCIILENGLKQTKEKVKFYYCNCDPNEINQICEECAISCHKSLGHQISEQPPAYIKCYCGEKAHFVTVSSKSTHLFKPSCFYHELVKVSELNIFFVNEKNEKVCLFCTNFCNDNKSSHKKIKVNSSQEIPNCECSHLNHKDKKKIYSITDRIGMKSFNIDFCGLKQVQIVNLLIKSKNSFENLYSDLLSEDYSISDKKIHQTNYFLAMKNFAIISKNVDGLKYFSENLINFPYLQDDFIKNIILNEFVDSISFLNAIKYVFQSYKQIKLSYHLKSLPKFKIFDLENISALQRLVLLNKNKVEMREFNERYMNENFNIIDLLILALRRLSSIRYENYEAYDVINSITNILRYLSHFYLLNNNQMIDFCEEMDKMFPIFDRIRNKMKNSQNYEKVIENESKLFLKIVKTLHMFIYSYNDQIFLNLLQKEEFNYENLNFCHNKTEIGRGIFRITMKILHLVSKEYIELNQNLYPIYNKIMRHGTQILNLFTNLNDTYGISLKKNLNNSDIYLKILKGESDIKNLNFLNSKTKEIEDNFNEFANFNLNANSLCQKVEKAIDSIFIEFNLANFEHLVNLKNELGVSKSLDFSNLNEEEDKLIKKNHQKRLLMTESNDDYLIRDKNNQGMNENRNLLYHSNFLFTVLKILKLVNIDPIENKQLVKKIYSLLWFFVDKNNDNAIIIISSNILSPLKRLPQNFSDKNFEIFLHSILLIAEKEELGFSKHLIKKLGNYLLKISNKNQDKYICLNYFLKIVDCLLNDIKSPNYKLTIIKIKSIMITIFDKFSIFNDFVQFLLTITEDVLYGKYNYFNVEDYEEKKEDVLNPNNTIFFKLSEIQNDTKFTIFNSLTFNIFFLFLKINNKIFNSSNVEDKNYLSKLFKKEEISYILKNKSLNLNIRTELIKYYRKTYIDILTNDNKESMDYYIRSLVKQMDESQIIHRAVNNFPADLYSSYEDLIKISENINTNNKMNSSQTYITANLNMTNKFDKESHELIMQEIKNYKEIIESTNNNKSSILNYFENGLVIPLNFYFRKIFSIINNISGEDFLNIYEMIPQLLKMKIYFVEKNMSIGFLQNLNEENVIEDKRKILDEIFSELKGYNKMTSYLVTHVIANTKVNEVTKDLNKMKNKNFPIFDYTLSHQIIESHHFNMLQNPKSNNFEILFKKENEENNKDKINSVKKYLEENYNNKNKIRLYEIAMVYHNSKVNLNKEVSSLGEGLEELCTEYETSFRNMLIRFLIFSLTKDKFINNNFSENAYFILFKLLQYHTREIQSDLQKILEEETKKRHEIKNRKEVSLPLQKSQNYEEVISLFVDDKKLKINFYDKNEINKLGFLNSIANHLFHKLFSIFVADFNPRDLIYDSDYLEAYNIIKIFKLMCEEHNNFFQGNLTKKLYFKYNYSVDNNNSENKIEFDKINFFDLMLLILNNILLCSNWNKVLDRNDNNVDYFYDLFSAIIDLLIEIIQGNLEENLSLIKVNKSENEFFTSNQKGDEDKLKINKVKKSPLQILIENVNKGLLFHDSDNNSVLYAVRTLLMNLILAILEEKNCSEDLKSYLIENLPVNKIISSINNTLKIYFIQNTENNNYWTNYLDKIFINKKDSQKENSLKNKNYKILKFDNVLLEYFTDEYFNKNNGFQESPEFEFANTLYRYIKLISIPPYQNEEASSLIKKVLELDENEVTKEMKNDMNIQSDKSNNKSDNPFALFSQNTKSCDMNFREQYFIIKFFEQITQTVEVITQDKQKSIVIFTVIPDIKYLSNETKEEFLKYVDRDNQFTKLYDLIRNLDYFKKEIEYNSANSSNKFYLLLKNLNFSTIQLLLFLLALAINLIMFFTLKGDQRKIYNFTDGSVPIPDSTDLTEFENNTTDASILFEREKIQQLIMTSTLEYAVSYWGLTICLIILCFIFIICYLYAKVPLYYQIELIKYKEHHKVKESEISFWEKTKMIIRDVIIGKDHINTLIFMTVSGLIAVIFPIGQLEMFYSMILLTIVNINPTLRNISKSDNYCESLIFCFFSHSGGGFRIDGAIGDFVLRKISYERDPSRYAKRYFYDLIFFIVSNIIMRELVFGIIIESFKFLRIKEQIDEHDKQNICFICGVSKDQLEKDRIDFANHCATDHNIWKYINYMIRLKFSDPQDLNAVNSFTLEQIENKYTNWIPFYNKKKDKEKEEEIDEIDLNVDTDKYNEIHHELPINKN